MEMQRHTRFEQQMRVMIAAEIDQLRTEVRQSVEDQGQVLTKLIQ